MGQPQLAGLPQVTQQSEVPIAEHPTYKGSLGPFQACAYQYGRTSLPGRPGALRISVMRRTQSSTQSMNANAGTRAVGACHSPRRLTSELRLLLKLPPSKSVLSKEGFNSESQCPLEMCAYTFRSPAATRSVQQNDKTINILKNPRQSRRP